MKPDAGMAVRSGPYPSVLVCSTRAAECESAVEQIRSWLSAGARRARSLGGPASIRTGPGTVEARARSDVCRHDSRRGRTRSYEIGIFAVHRRNRGSAPSCRKMKSNLC
jgi:hypothetical protein